MSKPNITHIPGGYKFTWKSTENIDIKVSRLHSSRDGGLKGELYITTTQPGYNPHIFLGQFNFTSSRSRKELSNQLKPVYDVDWEAIFEQLIVNTVELVRRGDPVEDIIADNEDLDPPNHIVEPYVIENYPNVFFGDPGSFKSTMAIVIMAAITLPWHQNPLRLKVPRDPVMTLMLDWETDRATVEWQLSCFQRGMGTGVIPIKYRRCSLPLHQDLEQIQNAIAETNAKLIVIDSLGLACGGELNEAGTAIAFFSALRQLKVTSLILAHTSKDKLSSNKSIYGSVYFEAQARNIWHLIKKQEPGTDELDLILKNTKSPPFRKRFQDLSYHVEFDDKSMVVKNQDPKNVKDVEEMSTQDRILVSISESPKSPIELAKDLNISPDVARQRILNLKSKGLIVKLDDGRYGRVTTMTNE